MSGNDPLLWLEQVDGKQALEWVKTQNQTTTDTLANDQDFTALRQRLLAILNADTRIPYVKQRGEYVYNFWQDANHIKGLWRRTTLAAYRSETPRWDTILDLDALAQQENENWVWRGAECLKPDNSRCLIALSRGGADATVTREFDIPSRQFVDGGFYLPEAKGGASWIDRDHVYVATNFGENTMTASGYPRVVKRWARGTSLANAKTVFEGEHSDIRVAAYRDHAPGYERDFVYRALTFYTNHLYQVTTVGLVKIDKPDDATAFVHNAQLILRLRSDWGDYPAGSLLAADYASWQHGKRELTVLFEPTPQSSLSAVERTKNHLILTILDNVNTRIECVTPGPQGWVRSSVNGLPELGQTSAWAVDSDSSDALWLNTTGYTTPASLWLANTPDARPELIKQAPALFNAEGLRVSQHRATSADGTEIPYFEVAPKALPALGAPTLLYGYGGFEVSLLPSYSAAVGSAWLERGGVFVVANIRGGGEFGPRWHQAALKQHRYRAYKDFAAVGDDLVRRGVTTVDKLGIQGGSNGGLLVGNMLTRYPERWGAVVCQVPLLDMRRYTKLLAGASWAGEYGDPDDPEQWEFIKTFSPYHNIDPNIDYPPILFTTSTRDDRVHPAHARKMAYALIEAGKDVTYYENIEGGHGGAADNQQQAFMSALAYTFLWQRLAGSR